MDNSSGKSSRPPRRPPSGKPFQKGDPRIQRGKGPPKGQGGRPPNEWYAQLKLIRDRFLQTAVAHDIAGNPDHPLYAKVGQWAHEQLEGRARQQVDVTSKGESLADILTAIAARRG